MTESCIWVRTDPGIDGVYRPAIDFDDDNAYQLDEKSALAYVMEILRAVAYAEYDAAVLAQMTKVSEGKAEGPELAVSIVQDLREDRPETTGVTPLRVIPGVSQATREPFLRIEIDGRPVGQWTPQDAREHALIVLESVIVADLDSAYLRMLRSLVGLEEDRARTVVGDLQNYRSGA